MKKSAAPAAEVRVAKPPRPFRPHPRWLAAIAIVLTLWLGYLLGLYFVGVWPRTHSAARTTTTAE